ncbi:MAG TPA: hypothetical protein VLF62_03830 [Candidatus Saccharimonadales bacterium]|nr:hypothetical protein [Candidatus Saccharimonadales bacterium]
MVHSNEVLRAHYSFGRSGHAHSVRELFIARVDNAAETADTIPNLTDADISHIAAQVLTVRDGRNVGSEALSLSALTDVLYENDTYVANTDRGIHLNGVLGYCIMDKSAVEGVIRVEEGAVRAIGPWGSSLNERSHMRVMAGMFRPLLEDYAPVPGDPASLAGVEFFVTSPYPGEHAETNMAQLGLQRVEFGFQGDAGQVYSAIGTTGLHHIRPKP